MIGDGNRRSRAVTGQQQPIGNVFQALGDVARAAGEQVARYRFEHVERSTAGTREVWTPLSGAADDDEMTFLDAADARQPVDTWDAFELAVQTQYDDRRTRQLALQPQLHLLVAPQAEQRQPGDVQVCRQERTRVPQRQQVGVCVRQERDLRVAASRRPRGRCFVARSRVPVVEVEHEFGKVPRRRDEAIGVQHHVDVVEDQADVPGCVDRVEPHRSSVEHERRNVGERARSETAALGEVHGLPQLAAQPLRLVSVDRHRRVTAFRAAAAAAAEAVRQVCAPLDDVDRAAIGPHHALAIGLGHGSTPAAAAARSGTGRRCTQ